VESISLQGHLRGLFEQPLHHRQRAHCIEHLPVFGLDDLVQALRHRAHVRGHRMTGQLERAGNTIGANDLLIAAHARTLDLTLVTHKLREFERVPGLRLEDWLERKDE